MDSKLTEAISKQIYRKYPEVSGTRPTISSRPNGEFLLVCKGTGTTASGHPILRAVRVVASAEGKVLKVTSSK